MSGPEPLKRALGCGTIRVGNVQNETCQAILPRAFCSRGNPLQRHLCIHSIPLSVRRFHEGRGCAIPREHQITDPQIACRRQVGLSPTYENAAPTGGGEQHKKAENHPVTEHAVCNPGCKIRTLCRTQSAVRPSPSPSARHAKSKWQKRQACDRSTACLSPGPAAVRSLKVRLRPFRFEQ